MIKSISLENFRRFKKLNLEFNENIIIFLSPNATGKTTLLEAISFLSNGDSFWAKNLIELYHSEKEGETSEYFRVAAVYEENAEKKEYSVYNDLQKRVYAVDEKRTTRKKFLSGLAATFFSPEQIELLMLSPDRRRSFLDDFIKKVDIEYEDLLSRFGKALKQRNAYVKKLSKRFYDDGFINPDDQQLLYWTDIFSTLSTQVIQKRMKYIDILKNHSFYLKYLPSLKFNEFHEMAENEEIINIHKEQLREKLKRDVALGYTNIGAHRDDWKLVAERDVQAFGSRGQKRMAITQLIFRSQQLLSVQLGFYPTLLLDDISSELDEANTKRILTDEIIGKQQVFITSTTLEGFPEEMVRSAQVVELNGVG